MHKRDAHTPPRDNWRYYDWIMEGQPKDDNRATSAPYAIRWLEDGVYDRKDYDAGIIQMGEELDANENMWQ